MLWKLAFTAAVIVIVFLLGQRSARGHVEDGAKRRRVPRSRRLGQSLRRRPRQTRSPEPMTDLVLCPDCGRYHAALERCRCKD